MASFEAEDQAASEPGPAEPADPMDQSSGEAGPSKPKQSGGSTEEWWHSDDSAEDSDDEPIVVQDELYDEEEDDELELDQVQQGNVAASQTLSCPCCFTVICTDCQRHEKHHNQWRAMFVQDCLVRPDQLQAAADGEVVSTVECGKCGTTV